MARKTIDITISEEGRDKGKVFELTEMSPWDAEAFVTKIFFALMNSGVEIPEGIEDAGLSGLYSLGINGLKYIKYEFAEPLLQQMLGCIKFRYSQDASRALIASDIEEVKTLLKLRKKLFHLHFDFLGQGGVSTSESLVPKETTA